MAWKSDTRRDYARNRSGYASSTTDKEWERILPQLPKAKVRGRPRKHDLRRIVDGIFYLLQSGCQWDMLPKDFPPWQTVYRYFRDWRKDGTWARLHDALYRDIRDLEGREESPSFAIVDSQSVKTGPDAREMVGFDAGKKVKGRKRHIVVDILGMMLNVKVHGADLQDRDGLALACEWLVQRFPFIKKICADAGYQGPIARKNSPRPLEIIKRNQSAFEVLPKRWIVERTLAWLSINRRLAKDYERFAETAETFIQIAMIKLMTRRLARFLEF